MTLPSELMLEATTTPMTPKPIVMMRESMMPSRPSCLASRSSLGGIGAFSFDQPLIKVDHRHGPCRS